MESTWHVAFFPGNNTVSQPAIKICSLPLVKIRGSWRWPPYQRASQISIQSLQAHALFQRSQRTREPEKPPGWQASQTGIGFSLWSRVHRPSILPGTP